MEVALKKRLLSSSLQREYSNTRPTFFFFFFTIAKDCSTLSLNARLALKANTILAMQEEMQTDVNEPNMLVENQPSDPEPDVFFLLVTTLSSFMSSPLVLIFCLLNSLQVSLERSPCYFQVIS